MEPAYSESSVGVPKRRTPWDTLSARVISIVSRKGGVGKTTSAVNLGAAFALSGHTVLVIGTDPQCGVATTLGARVADLDSGLLDLWDRDADLTSLAHPCALKGLFFVSSRILGFDDERRYLTAMEQHADAFGQQIDRARNLYDTIIIDCPPNLGAPTRAAIAASDSVLVPVQAEELCRESLGALLGSIDELKEEQGNQILEGPELEGIFLTMHNQRTRMSRHVAARVAEEFGPVLLETVVPRATRLSEMALRGKPSVIFDRRSPGSRAYFNLADEIITRYREREGLAAPGVAIPDGDDKSSTTATSTAPRRRRSSDGEGLGARGGLERLLGDLRARDGLPAPDGPLTHERDGLDLVSLDDLLAEEENSEAHWDGRSHLDDRLN